MTPGKASEGVSSALLDTTVQIDFWKGKLRRARIEELLKEYDWTVTTGICLLEFKAVLIQECITIHDRLCQVKLYTRVADRLTESPHPQARLRSHILRNLVNVFAPSSFTVTPEQDRVLAEKARLKLANDIPKLYRWFRAESVDAVLNDEINCTRAEEAPKKRTVAFAPNLPLCKTAVNKFCHIEEFIRIKAQPLLERIELMLQSVPPDKLTQLRRTCELLRSVVTDPAKQLSHSNCRRAGDFLIALEAAGRATHALSTNAADWEPICALTKHEFVRVDYPAEAEI